MENALRDTILRLSVLKRRREEVGLSSVEWVEMEVLGKLVKEWNAGYRPVGLAA